MNDHLTQAEDRLIDTLQVSVRGPRRNGFFALWLFVHACDDALRPGDFNARAHRRRLEALERRLSSLSLPPSFRKALNTSVMTVAEGPGDPVVAALKQLVSPAREALGKEAGEAVALAMRSASDVMLGQEASTDE